MTKADWRRSMTEHEAILASLEARDGPCLGRILEAHVAATWQTVPAAIGEEGATSPLSARAKAAG
ncbi:MAG: hypothetical protein JWR00_83 [Rubritepida sp.]|nr:hypothetical protein [Rubritepida sp.]